MTANRRMVALALLVGLGALFVLFSPSPQPFSYGGRGAGSEGAPAERHITVEAASFTYRPARLQVNQGDRVVLELTSADVVHGLYLDGYGINLTAEPGHNARAEFVAAQSGTFHFRCSITCGPLHPFMIGQLSVSPNWPFWRAALLAIVATIGTFVYTSIRHPERNEEPALSKTKGSPDAGAL